MKSAWQTSGTASNYSGQVVSKGTAWLGSLLGPPVRCTSLQHGLQMDQDVTEDVKDIAASLATPSWQPSGVVGQLPVCAVSSKIDRSSVHVPTLQLEDLG
jgi:hypothetical protein